MVFTSEFGLYEDDFNIYTDEAFCFNAGVHIRRLGVTFPKGFEELFISCSVKFASWSDWSESELTPTPQCSAGVFVCLSLLLWFTDTDLAEPILLVILYWIRAPGDPEEPSAPAAPSRSPGLQTEQDIHGWVRLLFSKNHEGFAVQR